MAANGLETGRITDLYESHPGIVSCRNVLPVGGAIPAKTDPQILTEVSARLRGRDRALAFADIVNWVGTFDPRIGDTTCDNGVQRSKWGVRRCIVVRIEVKQAEFHSEDELEILRYRLNSFLKSRSPVNTHFQIEFLSK